MVCCVLSVDAHHLRATEWQRFCSFTVQNLRGSRYSASVGALRELECVRRTNTPYGFVLVPQQDDHILPALLHVQLCT